MHPELSSLATTVATAKARVTVLAESLRDERDAGLAATLFEVERALSGASRQLERAIRQARDRG